MYELSKFLDSGDNICKYIDDSVIEKLSNFTPDLIYNYIGKNYKLFNFKHLFYVQKTKFNIATKKQLNKNVHLSWFNDYFENRKNHIINNDGKLTELGEKYDVKYLSKFIFSKCSYSLKDISEINSDLLHCLNLFDIYSLLVYHIINSSNTSVINLSFYYQERNFLKSLGYLLELDSNEFILNNKGINFWNKIKKYEL